VESSTSDQTGVTGNEAISKGEGNARGKDDLTKIKGIGMKTSRLLNRHDIKTYESVAASTPESSRRSRAHVCIQQS
jgi:predicted flap endonuclease-1-like 5' DNA nuclease